MMPIICPPNDESTFSSPVGYPAAKMPDPEHPQEARDPVDGDRTDRIVDPEPLLDQPPAR